MDVVSKYIKENWCKTIRPKEELSGDIKINNPYMSPCIVDTFTEMYYWDTYFINLGLLEDNMLEQALNNIDNFSIFIDKLGFIPNANYILDRSQPPFFTKMIFDYYNKTNDIKIIEKYLPYSIKEYTFWMSQRLDSFGLNCYSTNANRELILENYKWHASRTLEQRTDDEQEKFVLGKNLMAVAESGLDFNLRFRTKKRNCDAAKFIQLDINCILYDVEIMISKMSKLLYDNNTSQKFALYAKSRKELVDKYLYCKEKHMYLDYNYVDNCFSSVISVVSLYPYVFGLSDNKEDAINVLSHLEYEYGLSTCQKRINDFYLQWDYPCMWPPMVALCFKGLINLNAISDATRIAKKYIDAVYNTFIQTGKIWEKYDSVHGGVGNAIEYKTPEMLGWSAGVYRYLIEKIKLFNK